MGMFTDVKVASSGGGDYLRLKDGDAFKVRFWGNVVVFNDSYGNTRWGNVVWNYDEGKAQAYGYTKTIVNRVQELEQDDDWGDVRKYDVKVSRKGSTKEDTEYNLTPSPKSEPLTKEQEDACAALDLFKMFKGSISVQEANEGKEPEQPEPRVEGELSGYEKAKAIAHQLGGKSEKEYEFKDEDAPISLDEIPF